MIRRHELTDAEWEKLKELFPAGRKGRPREDDRRIPNGIVWKVRTGSAWRDVPERYGSWQTLYTRFRRWALDGTFSAMLAAVQADTDAVGDVDWLVAVDSTIVRAPARGRRAKKGAPSPRPLVGRPDPKTCPACDGRGRSLAWTSVDLLSAVIPS